jgi:periplasmic divalent cation tolerance protein
MSVSLIYTTCPSLELAKSITNSLIEEQLAACVNIIPGVQSYYRWEGQLEQSQELILLIKCRFDDYSMVEARIRSLHSYDCPCIIQIPLGFVSKDFENWVMAQKPNF